MPGNVLQLGQVYIRQLMNINTLFNVGTVYLKIWYHLSLSLSLSLYTSGFIMQIPNCQFVQFLFPRFCLEDFQFSVSLFVSLKRSVDSVKNLCLYPCVQLHRTLNHLANLDLIHVATGHSDKPWFQFHKWQHWTVISSSYLPLKNTIIFINY